MGLSIQTPECDPWKQVEKTIDNLFCKCIITMQFVRKRKYTAFFPTFYVIKNIMRSVYIKNWNV